MGFKLQIYREGAAHLLVDIDKQTEFRHQVMGEHLIRAVISSPVPLDLREGDYVTRGAERFAINRPAVPLEKESSQDYTYILDLEGYVYDLREQPFMHLGALEFSLYMKPRDILQLIVDNMNTVFDGWAVGEVEDLPEQDVQFADEGKGLSCKGALIKVADQFKLEFWLEGKTINLTTQAGVDTGLVFSYGQGNGLYRIVRGSLADQEYFNRIIVQGGTKNLPYTYRNRAERLRLEEEWLELPLLPGQKRRTTSVIIDDIFPRRTGTLTAVSADYLSLTDTSIPFDLDGQAIGGETPIIKFVSGANSGETFDIKDYDHVTKTLRIEKATKANGYELPNATYELKVGDRYVFLNIIQPQAYIDDAENELRVAGQKRLAKGNPFPPYTVYLDPKFLRDNGVTVSIGDKVTIEDQELGINATIRTTGIVFPLVDPNELDLTISESIPLNPVDKVQVEIKKGGQKTVVNSRINAELARRQAKNFEKLQNRIFDPDGNLSKGALTLLAGMLKIGFDSQNFGLVNTRIDAKTGGDPNHFSISAGKLVHYTYGIDGLGYQWNMSAAEWEGLDPAKYYYVYAKCSKSALTGTWEISETEVMTNAYDGYWCFNLGQLYEVGAEDYRDFDFTKGVTWIVGNQITTGRIQDLSKQNFFDLETGQFNLGTLLSGIDWDITNAGKLTIRGGLVQNSGGITSPLGVYRGQFLSGVTYYPGDEVTHLGELYVMKYPTPISNISPVSPTYWTKKIEKGTNGLNGKYTELRFAKNGSPTAPPEINIYQYEPDGWSLTEPVLGPLEYMWRVSAVKVDGILQAPWSSPVRFSAVDGAPGAPGADGARGPFPLGKGVWDTGKEYYGGADRVEIVKYGPNWYVTRTDAGFIPIGTLPTSATYYNAFGGQFESIATGLLFAELAYIENLGVRYMRTSDAGKRIEINRNDQNSQEFFDPSDKRVIHFDDDAAVDGDGTYNTYAAVYDDLGNPTWLYSRVDSGGTKYTYPYKDAGISIGYSPIDAAGYTTIGRKRIRTTGVVMASDQDGNNQTRMTQTGFQITGGLGEGILEGTTGTFYSDGQAIRVVGGIIVSIT